MAGYVPEGKQVRDWTTIPQPPAHQPSPRPGPVHTGSSLQYSQPWPGDAEAQPGTMSRVANTLQQNIGNYLLFRAVMDMEGAGPKESVDPDGPSAPTLPSPNELNRGARPHGGPTPPGPAGEIGPGPRGLGPGPAGIGPGPSRSPAASNTGSAAPLGPSRSGQALDRGIDAARAEIRDDFTNKDQTGSALFPREAFNGPIAMGPRAEDRRPKGRDTRAKNRFVQGKLF